ncbi:hypothetical protein CLIM01_04742 [Colletotrichum limetticola]|uniref:Uncharacterized protein n=1 Tax=Colletotrichum limetticola TaxID=1209924 RepID=A0ABQ9Q259_9PEZI|nr:hypothetical protein CLIM01_04742 [Colletotrichum limetticola]
MWHKANSTPSPRTKTGGQELQRRTGITGTKKDAEWVISALAPVGAFLFQFPKNHKS